MGYITVEFLTGKENEKNIPHVLFDNLQTLWQFHPYKLIQCTLIVFKLKGHNLYFN